MRAVSDLDVIRVPGWFGRVDLQAFRVLLAASGRALGGDLAELGAYKGKSAVLIGAYLEPGETFTVVDLFGAEAGDDANHAENAKSYATLVRGEFEANYLRVHGELPVVVQDFSSAIVDHAAPGTHRFVHVDASHLFEHVREDIEAARALLKPDGIVVLDDYRSPHTPGVAAAAWQAVGAGLRPFLLTPNKMYATWGDTGLWRGPVQEWARRGGLLHQSQEICGVPVERVWAKEPRAARYLPPVAVGSLKKLYSRRG